MWFIGVEVEQETIAPPPKENPGSAPGEGVDSHTKTDIYRSVSRNLFMHSHKRYLNEQI